jgi:hypothetical protein
MLVEIEGERARILAGLAMRMRLLQILGPVRALRVAQAVARMGGPVLGVDWGRRDFLRRAGGALIAQITLSILGSPKSVKVEHEPASPKPPAEISVEPADAHTYTQMLRHAFNNTHVLRISWFLKAQGFAPYESPSVMRIRESNKLVRTVAIHRYVTDGQEAVLAYGEEVSGLVWAYAIVIPNNGQRYALRVGSSGQIERFEAPMINQVDWDCLICNALCSGLCSVGCALARVIICGPNVVCTLICGGMCGGLCGEGCYFGCGPFC